jgi:heme exporter protein A
MNNKMKLFCKSVDKNFGTHRIFRDINFEIQSGHSIAITGSNGSGKTTLIRILCGLIRANSGKIEYQVDDHIVPEDQIYHHIGLVGPYLELYEELSAYENMRFFAKMKRIQDYDLIIHSLLKRVRLEGREDEPVKNYSSGMRQRLKYVFALLNQPEVLFLDEPTSNLDSEGIETVYQIMEEQKKDKILVIATNDAADLKYGDRQIAVSK